MNTLACPLCLISTAAWASAQVPSASVGKVHQIVSQRGGLLMAEYGQLEKALHIEAPPTPADAAPQHALASEGAGRLLTLLLTLPHGVLKYSHAVEGGLGCAGLRMPWDVPRDLQAEAAVWLVAGGAWKHVCCTFVQLSGALRFV